MSQGTALLSQTPARVQDILVTLNQLAPFHWTKQVYPEDNVGLLLGFGAAPVSRVLCALDISLETIQEAAGLRAQLLVTHHPPTFGLATVTDQTPAGRHLLALAQRRISAICMHTNWDAAPRGANEALAEAVGLTPPFEFLDRSYRHTDGRMYGLGRIGSLPAPLKPMEFALAVKAALRGEGVRLFTGSRPVSRVAVCSGSGGSLWESVIRKRCDAFVTGDVKHHMFIEARAMDITLIDAGHFPTENLSMPHLAACLQHAHPGLTVHVSQISHEPSFL